MNYRKIYPTNRQKEISYMMMQKPFEIFTQRFLPVKHLPPSRQIEPVLFCQCVWSEARNQPLEGIRLVATVIMNRYQRQESYWGRTVGEIITKSNNNGIFQFSCMNPVDINYKKMNEPDMGSWFKVVNHCLTCYFEPEPIGDDSPFYYCTKECADKSFFKTLRVVDTVGDHVFFTDDRVNSSMTNG